VFGTLLLTLRITTRFRFRRLVPSRVVLLIVLTDAPATKDRHLASASHEYNDWLFVVGHAFPVGQPVGRFERTYGVLCTFKYSLSFPLLSCLFRFPCSLLHRACLRFFFSVAAYCLPSFYLIEAEADTKSFFSILGPVLSVQHSHLPKDN
jgi:hypothetical protein